MNTCLEKKKNLKINVISLTTIWVLGIYCQLDDQIHIEMKELRISKAKQSVSVLLNKIIKTL